MNLNTKKGRSKRWSTLLLLLLFFGLTGIHAQDVTNITVSGTVSSEQETLPGASVTVKGTSMGVMTDFDGNYTITVPNENSILEFTYMGYLSQDIKVGNQRTINVILREDTQMLSEVVVVGYGQMKRSDLTGSIASVSSEAITKSVPTSIDQVLQGRAAGVQIQQNSGMPGSSSSIRIRGINSLNGSNEPIFVIDGVVIDGNTNSNNENPLSSINPADIVSMDILKDASATAIYGSRGANGVIIITTLKGQQGTARVNYNGYIGWQEIPQMLDLMNLQEYAYHKNERTQIMGYPMDDAFVRPDLLGEGTDWQKELFQQAMMTNHNLSISGGSEKTDYAMNLGYLDQEGIAYGSGFQRLNLQGNFNTQVKPWLKAGVNLAVSNAKQTATVGTYDGNNSNIISTALFQTPNVAVKNLDGSYGGPDTDEFVQSNPIGLALLKENKSERSAIRSNVYLDFKIIDGLSFKTEFASDIGINNGYRFTPSYSFGAIVNEVIESERDKSYSVFWSWNNLLNYTKTFNEVHDVNLMLGQEIQESKWEYLQGYRRGFVGNSAHDLDAGDPSTATNIGNSGGNSMSSFFGRAFYSYNNCYLFTGTLRYDGSSLLAPGHQWAWFPSTAIAWRVSEESFLQDVEKLNNLKLRFGWGLVGNQNVALYAYTATLATVATPWGVGLLAANSPNPDLEWETTSSFNLGFDLGILNNRIDLVFDLYHKKTNNLLLQVPLPAYMGSSGQGSVASPWKNIGSIENKGLEVTLNTANIQSKDFTWSSNFVFSLNRNKVVSLDTETSILDVTMSKGSETTIITRTQVGQPIGQFYGYKVIGRFEQATDFYYKDANGEVKQVAIPEGQVISQNGVWIGDLIFEDVNGDGVINDSDRTIIGNPEPDFTYGIGNTFSYKDFDLTIFFNGSYGNDVYNWIRRWTDDPRQSTNLHTRASTFARLELIDPNGSADDFRNVRVAAGAGEYMPRLSPSDANGNYRVSDRFVEDGSYIRLQNISFGYNLPKKIVNKIGAENLRVYANLQNVYTWTKYKGYDPEIGSMNQNALLTGVDNARYPSPRIYTFGLNVTF